MKLLAIALAASLLIGPPGDKAPAETSEREAASEADTLPDVEDPVGIEASPEPEPTPEPTPEPEAAPEPEPTPEPPPPTVEAPEPGLALAAPVTRDKLGCDGSKACRRMSIAGIVVGTLGVAAVGTGIALVVKPDEVIPESPTFVTSTRPAGTVALTIGAGVTLTSVLMLIAAHRGYKKRGDEARRVEPLTNGSRF